MESIEKCCKAKYLGLILDENLNWKAHVQHLQKKLSCAVGIIAKLRHYLNPKNLLSVYYCCVTDRKIRARRNSKALLAKHLTFQPNLKYLEFILESF